MQQLNVRYICQVAKRVFEKQFKILCANTLWSQKTPWKFLELKFDQFLSFPIQKNSHGVLESKLVTWLWIWQTDYLPLLSFRFTNVSLIILLSKTPCELLYFWRNQSSFSPKNFWGVFWHHKVFAHTILTCLLKNFSFYLLRLFATRHL